MKKQFSSLKGLKTFFVVWSTQNLSVLGSAMTSFALVIWSYQQQGSALTTALLSVCSYAPYVLLSIFAGSLGDRWDKRKTMALCDAFAALTTLAVLVLLHKVGEPPCQDLLHGFVVVRMSVQFLDAGLEPWKTTMEATMSSAPVLEMS